MISNSSFEFWLGLTVALATVGWPKEPYAQETSQGSKGMQGDHMMMSPGLMMPSMNSANGRKLFASKGCVVCHAVNGLGGTDAAPLDASTKKGMT